ncbi:MAG TPA: hypothetical protein VFX42_03790, partial [Gemmatimonadales bacterium]|nr:hypothetical protein [Gemmatimonadales bacterium]
MKTPRALQVLTALNLLLLLIILIQSRPAVASDGIAPVLRGRGLEIVDQRGRVRASIQILPPDPNFRMPDGTVGYKETVLLRLINSEGRPNVKLGAGESGSGLLLAGPEDPTYVQILAEG